MPDQFKDMPYQPFSKGDRLGKVMHVKWRVTYVEVGECYSS
jgi:translation initiation factor 3 subunit D